MLPVRGKGASLVAQMVKRLPAMRETWVLSLGREDPLEKEMATHSNTLAWKIPWMEEPDRLQFMGLQRVGHDWATSLALEERGFLRGTRVKNLLANARHKRCGFSPWVRKIPWRRTWQLTPVCLPENPWTEETAWIQSIAFQRVGHNWNNLAMGGRQLVPWEL